VGAKRAQPGYRSDSERELKHRLQQSTFDSCGTECSCGLLVSFCRYHRVIPLEHHPRSAIIRLFAST